MDNLPDKEFIHFIKLCFVVLSPAFLLAGLIGLPKVYMFFLNIFTNNKNKKTRYSFSHASSSQRGSDLSSSRDFIMTMETWPNGGFSAQSFNIIGSFPLVSSGEFSIGQLRTNPDNQRTKVVEKKVDMEKDKYTKKTTATALEIRREISEAIETKDIYDLVEKKNEKTV